MLEIGLALADALAHAHARGVIHRDIKPQNVLVPDASAERAPRGAAKLTDFGGAQPRRRGRAHAHRRRARHARLHGARAERGPRGRASRPTCTRSRSCCTRPSAVNPVRGATPAATARRIGIADRAAGAGAGGPAAGSSPRSIARSPARRGPGALAGARRRARGGARPRRPRARRGELSRRNAREGGAQAWHTGLRVRLTGARVPRAPRHGALAPATEIALQGTPGSTRSGARAWHSNASARTARRSCASPRSGASPRTRRTAIEPPRPPCRARWWIGLGAAAVAWQATAGRPGKALVLALAFAPLMALPRRAGLGWLWAALAPSVLGLVRLAELFPRRPGRPADGACVRRSAPWATGGSCSPSRCCGTAPVARPTRGDSAARAVGDLAARRRGARGRAHAQHGRPAGRRAVGRRRGLPALAGPWAARGTRRGRGHDVVGGACRGRASFDHGLSRRGHPRACPAAAGKAPARRTRPRTGASAAHSQPSPARLGRAVGGEGER